MASFGRIIQSLQGSGFRNFAEVQDELKQKGYAVAQSIKNSQNK